MARFQGFKNAFSNENRIYSIEDVLNMPMAEFLDREEELDTQDNMIGLPTNSELKSSPNVRYFESYTDDNGVNFPSRWESFTMENSKISPKVKQNSDIPKRDFVTGNRYSDLEEFLRKELEKLKRISQPVQTHILQNDAGITNNELEFDTEIEPHKSGEEVDNDLNLNENVKNTDTLSQFLDGFVQAISKSNQKESFAGENIEPKFYQVDPNQQKVINYMNNDLTMNEEEEKLRKHQEELKQQNRFPDGVIQAPVEDYNPQIYGHVETSDIEDNLFRKPVEPIKDVVNEILNNKTDYDTPKTDWEKFQEKVYTDYSKEIFPMSSSSTENGINKMKAAKENANATVHTSLNDISNEDLKNSLKEYGAKDDMQGVQYNSDSDYAKKLEDSNEIKNYVDDMCKNGGIAANNILNFRFDIKDPINSFDRYSSIQHSKIYNPRISDDGNYMEGSIIDISDFEKRPANIKNIPNNWGKNMQDKGQYQNYYVIIDIKVPLTDEQKELLRKYKL